MTHPGLEPGTLQLWPTELVRPLLFVDRREVLEPSTGFEPALSAWKAEVLPLHHDGIWYRKMDSNHLLRLIRTVLHLLSYTGISKPFTGFIIFS